MKYVSTENHRSLNLRAEPSTSAKVLAQIPYNQALEATPVDGEWSQVTYNNITGYAMSKYLIEKPITRDDLQQIYESLSQTLQTIKNILER